MNNKKMIRSWAMYDWANSAFSTTILATVMPIFYSSVAGKDLSPTTSTAYWGYTQSISLFLIVLLSPVLGAIADAGKGKKGFLKFFTALGAIASLLMATIREGGWLWASFLVLIGSLAFAGATTFYDAFLTDVAPEAKRDQVSTAGYAYGYIGGGLLLALNLALIQFHDSFSITKLTATRLSFLSVGIWWWFFSLPLFQHVKERIPDKPVPPMLTLAKTGIRRVWISLTQVRKYPELVKFLIAFWFFNDGINTIIKMATIYGTEIGIDQTDLIAALLITQFVGVPCTLLFGNIAKRIGGKAALILTLISYLLIVILGYFMTTAIHFYLLAVFVGFVQGGSQALSRSLFSRLVPIHKNAEFFGFYGLCGKFSAIFGPAVFGLVGQLTGSSRNGIASLALFFVIGIVLLLMVDLEKGKREALAGGDSSDQGMKMA
jgi:MFS transporter, UMF1 family